MPKLPLDPNRLRALSTSVVGLARDAVRHPRRTVTQAVSGTVEIVGVVARRGSATISRPNPEAPVAPTPAAPATEDSVPESWAEAAPAPEPESAVEAEPTAEPAAEPEASAEPPEEHLTGPAPHLPAGLAKDIERDFDDDIPGIRHGSD